MSPNSPRNSWSFDTLTATWERLAAELNAKFTNERTDPEFRFDFHRGIPFGRFRDLPTNDISPWNMNWPRITAEYKNFEIVIKPFFPTHNDMDPFLVTAQANFELNTPFYIRARKRSMVIPFLDWFLTTRLGKPVDVWVESMWTKKSLDMIFETEAVIGSHRIHSGLPEFESHFSIDSTSEKTGERLFALPSMRDQLLTHMGSLRMAVFRAIPDTETNCVFLIGLINGKKIDETRQFLTFMTVSLDSLLALDLISPNK